VCRESGRGEEKTEKKSTAEKNDLGKAIVDEEEEEEPHWPS